LTRFSGPSANVSTELSELVNVVEVHDLFNESEALFRRHLKGEDVDLSKVVENMDEAIRVSKNIIELTRKEEGPDERQIILRFVTNAMRLKAAVAALTSEADYDPTGDNIEQLETLTMDAMSDVNEALSIFMKDINEDIQAANNAMKNVLDGGRMMSLIGLAGGGVGGLVIIVLINMVLNHHLLRVVDGTRKIAKGDLAHRIRIKSDDELGRLAYFFNKMAADLQQRETDLKVSKNLHQTLVDNVGLGITLIDRNYEILMVNAAQRELAGKSARRMVGERCFTALREREVACSNCPGRRAMATVRPERVERSGKREDGSEFHATVTAFPVLDLAGGVEGFVEVVEDVTDRKRAEEALRKSEEKHRAILEDMGDGYFEVDPGGHFTFFNRAIRESLGQTREGMEGLNYKTYVDERDLDKVFRAFNQVYATGEPGREIEYRIVAKNGEVKTVESSIYLIKNREGEKIGFRGVSRDVTQKRELESSLQRAEKMEAVGALAGGVAHDLNNILSGIVSYPELLLLDLPGESPMRKPLRTIQKSGEKAAAIVQDLLTLARRGVAVKEATDLNFIVSDYLNSPEFKKLQSFHVDVRVETRLDSELLNISGSPVHLSKTVMNLVSNAAEAIPGEGTVTISTENRYLEGKKGRRGVMAEGDYVVLIVRDDGAGVSPGDQAKIFEPFYTKKAMGRSGTGLGMAVVWGTVKDHGGHIELESREGEGAVFTIYFPATRAETPSRVRPAPTLAEYQGRGESILVVDDVPEQREIAARMLKRLGYAIAVAASGEEAAAYLKEHHADLLILDMIRDPGIDGLETYQRIIEFRPGQKAIIASGFSETERVKEAER
ncbi:MAG: PAS domain S-box protein, partial [Desulfobacterales bacterium]|nr:PAS domain S-box protein [Desulfobacterales bacterium]